MADENFLNALFSQMLGRGADAPGSLYWQNSDLPDGKVTDSFRQSDEATGNAPNSPASLYDPTQFLTSLYQDKLNRKPDAAGMAYWAQQMKNGQAPSTVTDNFKRSAEFKAGPGIDWANLKAQSQGYDAGLAQSPYVMDFSKVSPNPQTAFSQFYNPQQQAGGVTPIRGPGNVNVGPQAQDLGVGGLLSSALGGGQDWPTLISQLSQSNPDVAGLLSQLLKPTAPNATDPSASTRTAFV